MDKVISLSTGTELYRFPADRLVYISADGNYSTITTLDNHKYMVSFQLGQALVELGVDDAIYLVGSHSSFGWYMDADGEKTLFAPDVHRGLYRNENYIIWR